MIKSIKDSICALQGLNIPIGTTVAHPNDPLAKELVSYEGNVAVLELYGKEYRYPASEIFDVNAVKDRMIKKLLIDKLSNPGDKEYD